MRFSIGDVMEVQRVPDNDKFGWGKPFEYVGQRFVIRDVQVGTMIMEHPARLFMVLEIESEDTKKVGTIHVDLHYTERFGRDPGAINDIFNFQCHVHVKRTMSSSDFVVTEFAKEIRKEIDNQIIGELTDD